MVDTEIVVCRVLFAGESWLEVSQSDLLSVELVGARWRAWPLWAEAESILSVRWTGFQIDGSDRSLWTRVLISWMQRVEMKLNGVFVKGVIFSI